MILKQFDSQKKLEKKLAKYIINILLNSIETRGTSNILLSGGSTPLNLYKTLGSYEINWSKVNIGLVDERFVPVNSEFNNHSKIKDSLNENSIMEIDVLPMVLNDSNFEENLKHLTLTYNSFFSHIDFCLLGMGEDGHTASIFPNDLESIKLIADTNKNIGSAYAPNHPTRRISCNKTMLSSSTNNVLLILGKKKLKILQNSMDKGLPISEFSSAKNELNVYYAE
ncbi:6-phosphogluconolactonase [Crocinitomicaceae bacterium]|nr:6-phosphogluconolactonase [Crocinitomicaceae bacterium]MDC1186426.1 6-phosphogluconolactonase [Crocinitomicaceae bacterium]